MEISDAIRSNDLEKLRALIDGAHRPTEFNVYDETGLFPLHYAVGCGNTVAAEMLLSAGADPNIGRFGEFWNEDVVTGQILVGYAGNRPVYRGAVPDDEDGCTPLHLAAAKGDGVSLDLLVAYKADLDPRTVYGFTPLHLAAEMGQGEIVDSLICRGADARARTINGETPLHIAAKYGNIECVSKLLDAEADIDGHVWDVREALGVALESGNAEVADLLRSRMPH